MTDPQPNQPATPPPGAPSEPQAFGFTQGQTPNPFISTPPVENKKKSPFTRKTLVLVAATVLVGASVPLTVFLIKNRQDIRSRASEEAVTITPPPYPTFKPTAAPTPKITGCTQSCTTHADCVAGFFCDSGECKNALCPTSTDCQCDAQ